MPLHGMGRALIFAGMLLVVVGLVLTLGARLPRLPGDVFIQRPNATIYVPIGTMILVSVLLTIILNIVFRR